MIMAVDTTLNELIINKISKEQYEQLIAENKVNENELYITDENNSVPTKLSELTNDTGFITNETVYNKDEVDNLISNSIVDLSEYAKTEDINNALNLKSDKESTYTKTEVDNLLSPKATTEYVDGQIDSLNKSLETKADKSELPTKVSKLENDVEYVTQDSISESLSLKQDVLIPSDGITIEDNVISTIVYQAGENIVFEKATGKKVGNTNTYYNTYTGDLYENENGDLVILKDLGLPQKYLRTTSYFGNSNDLNDFIDVSGNLKAFNIKFKLTQLPIIDDTYSSLFGGAYNIFPKTNIKINYNVTSDTVTFIQEYYEESNNSHIIINTYVIENASSKLLNQWVNFSLYKEDSVWKIDVDNLGVLTAGENNNYDLGITYWSYIFICNAYSLNNNQSSENGYFVYDLDLSETGIYDENGLVLGFCSEETTNTINISTSVNIPTKISAFENDSGYLTEHQDISSKADIDYVDNRIENTSNELRDLHYQDINNIYTTIDSNNQNIFEQLNQKPERWEVENIVYNNTPQIVGGEYIDVSDASMMSLFEHQPSDLILQQMSGQFAPTAYFDVDYFEYESPIIFDDLEQVENSSSSIYQYKIKEEYIPQLITVKKSDNSIYTLFDILNDDFYTSFGLTDLSYESKVEFLEEKLNGHADIHTLVLAMKMKAYDQDNELVEVLVGVYGDQYGNYIVPGILTWNMETTSIIDVNVGKIVKVDWNWNAREQLNQKANQYETYTKREVDEKLNEVTPNIQGGGYIDVITHYEQDIYEYEKSDNLNSEGLPDFGWTPIYTSVVPREYITLTEYLPTPSETYVFKVNEEDIHNLVTVHKADFSNLMFRDIVENSNIYSIYAPTLGFDPENLTDEQKAEIINIAYPNVNQDEMAWAGYCHAVEDTLLTNDFLGIFVKDNDGNYGLIVNLMGNIEPIGTIPAPIPPYKTIDLNNWTIETLNDKAFRHEIPSQVSQLNNDMGYITDVSNKADKADTYTKAEIDSKLVSIYKFKGNVANYDDLPTENMELGDVYNTLETGENYAWTEYGWDNLGINVDLTAYLTKSEAQSNYATINDVNNSLELKADKTELPTKLSELENDLNILPTQVDNAGKILMTDGETTTWDYASVIKKGDVETGLSQLVINNVTQEEYNELLNNNQIKDDQIYVIDDEYTNEEIKNMLDEKTSNEDFNDLKARVELLETTLGILSSALDNINGEVI